MDIRLVTFEIDTFNPINPNAIEYAFKQFQNIAVYTFSTRPRIFSILNRFS